MSMNGRYDSGPNIWHTITDSDTGDKSQDDVEHQTDDDVGALDELNGPKSWLHPAIASAIFCFFPTGIIAVIQARKAMKAYDNGDLHSWARYTGRARFLVFLTCILGLIVYGAIIGIVQAIQHTSSI